MCSSPCADVQRMVHVERRRGCQLSHHIAGGGGGGGKAAEALYGGREAGAGGGGAARPRSFRAPYSAPARSSASG